jgi:hypothetical protein
MKWRESMKVILPCVRENTGVNPLLCWYRIGYEETEHYFRAMSDGLRVS